MQRTGNGKKTDNCQVNPDHGHCIECSSKSKNLLGLERESKHNYNRSVANETHQRQQLRLPADHCQILLHVTPS